MMSAKEELSGIYNQGDFAWYCNSNSKETKMIQNSKENQCVKIYKPAL